MGLLLSHRVKLPSLALQTIQKAINSARLGAMGNTDLVYAVCLGHFLPQKYKWMEGN